MIRLCLLALLATGLAAADLLPTPPAEALELHGQLGTDRFWMRLTLPKPEFQGRRVVELVYTPPTAKDLAGAHLSDCPFLLVDDHLRLVAWNGRDSLSQVVSSPDGYQITREEVARTYDDKDDVATARKLTATGPAGWDERLAPAMLTLVWRAGSRGEVPCYDLFSASPAVSAVSWRDSELMIAGRPFRIVPDTSGRVARIEDASGHPVLTVTAWIPSTP
jgi:hypothetical protein